MPARRPGAADPRRAHERAPPGIREFRGFVRDFVADGRTIVLSSHLLDEVEKTCDHIAIVDEGRIAAQGSIDELRGTATRRVIVETDDLSRAREVLNTARFVLAVAEQDGALEVTVDDPGAAPRLNSLLVEAGLDVRRLELRQMTLEQRFLELTTRLGNDV